MVVTRDGCGGEALGLVRWGDELSAARVGLAAINPRDMRRPKLIGFCDGDDDDRPISKCIVKRKRENTLWRVDT